MDVTTYSISQATLFFPDAAKTCLDIIALSGEPLNPDAKAVLANARELTVVENWAYNDRRDKLRAEYHALMKAQGVDVILCAPYVGCAPLRNDMSWGNFTMIWNMLDHPALVFPTGLSVDAEVDVVDEEYKPMNEYVRAQYERCESELSGVVREVVLTVCRFPGGLPWCAVVFAIGWEAFSG